MSDDMKLAIKKNFPSITDFKSSDPNSILGLSRSYRTVIKTKCEKFIDSAFKRK